MGLYYPPRAQEHDSSGNPVGGGKLFFYEVGTSTKKTTYSDKALTSANANPVVADSAGRFDNIYTDGAYKVVLAPSTDSDPPTSAIYTEDDVSFGASGDFWGDTNTLTSATAINATHEKELVRCSGTFNLNLLSASSAGKGFVFFVKNDGTGIITIDPSGAEQINDSTAILLAQGDGGTVSCDGSEWTFDSHEAFKPWAKGADVVSAADLDISTLDGNVFDVTGANTITTIKTTGFIGSIIVLHFDAALTFTHDATNLILPGGANITTAAGDEAILIEYASADYRCISYTRASGATINPYPNNGYRASAYYNGLGYFVSGTLQVTADILYCRPFIVTSTAAFTRIGLEVTATAAGNARMGIYNWANGVATTLVVDLGTVDASGTGEKEVTISQTLAPGIYGIAVVFDNTPTVATVGRDTGFAHDFFGGAAANQQIGRITGAHTYAALPSPFPSATYSGTAPPQVWMRVV